MPEVSVRGLHQGRHGPGPGLDGGAEESQIQKNARKENGCTTDRTWVRTLEVKVSVTNQI